MSKIGILYCPNHRPFTTPQKRWEEIAALLAKHHVEYDMVQSEKQQSVGRLVNMMISNSYDTIVICGGDSALNDAVNCLMQKERHIRQNIALAVIPNGTMNDFANFWGFTYQNTEESIISLARHKIRKIDVGCIRYTNKENKQCSRYFLNCINVGLLATIQSLRSSMRRKLWSRKLSFAASLFLMVFHKVEHRITYDINNIKETHHVTTLCVSNALGYGQTPNATPYSSLLDVTVIRRNAWLQYFEAILLFIKGKILNHKRVLVYRTKDIAIRAPKGISITIDGHSSETPVGTFRITVEPEEISFIQN